MNGFQASASIAHYYLYRLTVERAKWKGSREREMIPQPTVVKDNNYGMRGADRFDQLLSYNRNEMQFQKWKL